MLGSGLHVSDVGEARIVDLRRQAIPRLLFSLLHERFTGILRLQQPGDDGGARTLVIRGGMPVHTDWVAAGTRLGAQLLARGAVAQADVQRALQQQRETGKRLGEILLEEGLVEKKPLAEALRTQCERRLVHMFALQEGEVRIEPRDEGERDALQVNVLELIARGVTAHYDAARVERQMGETLSNRFVTTAAFAKYRGHFGFPRQDEAALDRLATPEGASLDDLADILGDRDGAARMLYVLWACRMLTAHDDASSSRPIDGGAAGSVDASSLVEVEQRLRAGDDAYVVLGVDNDATTDVIDARFRQLATLADPRALPADASDADRSRAHQVFTALAQTRKAAHNRRRVLAEHKAQRLLDDGKFDRALPLFEEVAKIDPDDVEIRAALLWCRLRSMQDPTSDRSDLDGALSQFDELLATEPEVARLHYYRGFVLAWLGRSTDAIAAFDQAVARDSSLVDAQRQARALRAGKEASRPAAAKSADKSKGVAPFKPKKASKKRQASRNPFWQGPWPAIWISSAVLLVLMIVAQIVGRMDF